MENYTIFSIDDDGYYFFFVRPMGQIEQRAGCAPQARPVYPFHKVEIGRTEVETS